MQTTNMKNPAVGGNRGGVKSRVETTDSLPIVPTAVQIAAWLGVGVADLPGLRRRRHHDRYRGLDRAIRRRPVQLTEVAS